MKKDEITATNIHDKVLGLVQLKLATCGIQMTITRYSPDVYIGESSLERKGVFGSLGKLFYNFVSDRAEFRFEWDGKYVHTDPVYYNNGKSFEAFLEVLVSTIGVIKTKVPDEVRKENNGKGWILSYATQNVYGHRYEHEHECETAKQALSQFDSQQRGLGSWAGFRKEDVVGCVNLLDPITKVIMISYDVNGVRVADENRWMISFSVKYKGANDAYQFKFYVPSILAGLREYQQTRDGHSLASGFTSEMLIDSVDILDTRTGKVEARYGYDGKEAADTRLVPTSQLPYWMKYTVKRVGQPLTNYAICCDSREACLAAYKEHWKNELFDKHELKGNVVTITRGGEIVQQYNSLIGALSNQ